jgi:hypothetical protein
LSLNVFPENTCFANSVLQVLRYTPGFMEELTELKKEILTTEDDVKKFEVPEFLISI